MTTPGPVSTASTLFLDNFALPRPDRAGWHELVDRGLVRVSLGVESGDPDVRTIYHKSWADDELRRPSPTSRRPAWASAS